MHAALNDMTNRHSKLSDNLKRLRGEMSQSELAKRAGLSRSTIWRIENEDRDDVEMGTVRAIAQALGCDPLELLGKPAAVALPPREPAPTGPRTIHYVSAGTLLQLYLRSDLYRSAPPPPEALAWFADQPFIGMVGAELRPEEIPPMVHDAISQHLKGKF